MNKKLKLIILTFIVVLIVIPLFILLGSLGKQSKEEGENLPVPPSSSRIESIAIQNTKQEFVAGESNQKISISFSKPIQKGGVNITIKRKSIAEDNSIINVPISTSYDKEFKNLTITINEDIVEYSDYILELRDTTNNNLLASQTFLSEIPTPTQTSQNNLELSKYLPHKTKNFSLRYNGFRNIYTCSLLLDPDSPDDPNTQFEKAREDALEFIRDKGIDISTIKIEFNTN